jgi:hypothetical protein
MTNGIGRLWEIIDRVHAVRDRELGDRTGRRLDRLCARPSPGLSPKRKRPEETVQTIDEKEMAQSDSPLQAVAVGMSEWHRQWQRAYKSLGWLIEHPVEWEWGIKYRLDAYLPAGREANEFVHSLSDAYLPKHRGLLALGYDPYWLFDGDHLASDRWRGVPGDGRGSGVQWPLNQWAARQARELGLDRVHLHWQGSLLFHAADDVWYPTNNEDAGRLLRAFRNAGRLRACERNGARRIEAGRGGVSESG